MSTSKVIFIALVVACFVTFLSNRNRLPVVNVAPRPLFGPKPAATA